MSAVRQELANGRIVHPVRVVVRDGEVVRLKRCAGCGEDKVVGDSRRTSGFTPTRRNANGVVISWGPRCYACESQYRRDRGMNKDQYNRAQYLRMKGDPERLAIRRQQGNAANERWRKRLTTDERTEQMTRQRAYWAEYAAGKLAEDPRYFSAEARAARRAKREAELRRKDAERDARAPRLPAEPFRLYLEAYQEALKLLDAAAVARSLGICEKRASSVLAGNQDRITIDVVDAALIGARIPVRVGGRMIVTLDDLYPQD